MAEVLNRIPIRWRLALVSAALTFVILTAFATVIGQVTASRVRSDFNNQLAAAVDDHVLGGRIPLDRGDDVGPGEIGRHR